MLPSSSNDAKSTDIEYEYIHKQKKPAGFDSYDFATTKKRRA